MSRKIRIAAGQIGGVSREESRESVVNRHIALLEEAARRKVDVVAFGETTLTPFFPRWMIDEKNRWSPEVDKYFEKSMPNPSVQPLFDRAKELGVGFALGYAELDGDKHYNSYCLVGKDGKVIGNYRKSHLPGTEEHLISGALRGEVRYFLHGDTGFKVWPAFGGTVGLMICRDRREPESFRVLGLQSAELVFVPYCTGPRGLERGHLMEFQNQLCLQSGAYFNGYWVVGIAHGQEDETKYLTQSMIVSPRGEVVAMSYTLGDELVDCTVDLDEGKEKRTRLALGRRPDLFKSLAIPFSQDL